MALSKACRRGAVPSTAARSPARASPLGDNVSSRPAAPSSESSLDCSATLRSTAPRALSADGVLRRTRRVTHISCTAIFVGAGCSCVRSHGDVGPDRSQHDAMQGHENVEVTKPTVSACQWQLDFIDRMPILCAWLLHSGDEEWVWDGWMDGWVSAPRARTNSTDAFDASSPFAIIIAMGHQCTIDCHWCCCLIISLHVARNNCR